MSLLLTKNCDFAILVAIEDGQQFKEQLDKDVYLNSRLHLQLPPPVDDLIPPNTRLSTRSQVLTESPQWRTTLVYFVSQQLLNRLRKHSAHITLDITSLSEQSETAHIGSIELKMEDAKTVLIHKDNRDIEQIQAFVVDKGEWLPLHHPDHPVQGKIKAGLFLVKMPKTSTARNKEIGTPLQAPVRTSLNSYSPQPRSQSAELGLEISTDVSRVFGQQEASSLLDDDYDFQAYEYQNTEGYNDQVIQIGNGVDQYIFIFRILEARHLASIMSQYNDKIESAYVQYKFADQVFSCNMDPQEDSWKSIEYHKGVALQGHFEDIKAWIADQNMIEVLLVIKLDYEDEDRIVGLSEVYLKDKYMDLINQASIVYDVSKAWHINARKQFAQLRLQLGLLEGWNEPELH
ncbi:hypothetical protein BD560DRAFT_385671 [Blakeslea trispora]|nr:hypothetical protein BD560DRAFT_385671 [Blakeslea trispora]